MRLPALKFVRLVNLVLVVILGNTAGIPKVMGLKDELEFFQAVGLSESWLLPFGVVQIIGGLLLFPKKTRAVGAALTALMFLGSTIMIFATGNIGFGVVSIVPVLLALNLVERRWRSRPFERRIPASKKDGAPGSDAD